MTSLTFYNQQVQSRSKKSQKKNSYILHEIFHKLLMSTKSEWSKNSEKDLDKLDLNSLTVC